MRAQTRHTFIVMLWHLFTQSHIHTCIHAALYIRMQPTHIHVQTQTEELDIETQTDTEKQRQRHRSTVAQRH